MTGQADCLAQWIAGEPVGCNPGRLHTPGTTAVGALVDGARWLSLEGPAVIRRDAASIAEAVRRYADRYQAPRPNETRVAIEITVERILGRAAPLTGGPARS